MIEWGDVDEAIKYERSEKYPNLNDLAAQHAAFAAWCKSQSLTVPQTGTSLAALLGVMMGATATNEIDLLVLFTNTQDVMVAHALAELHRRLQNGEKKGG